MIRNLHYQRSQLRVRGADIRVRGLPVPRQGAMMSRRPARLETRESLPVKAALDAMGEGITLVDRDGRMYYSNPASRRILGRGPTDRPAEEWADFYGVFLPDGQTPFPPDRYPLIRALAGEPTDDVEMIIRNPSRSDPVRIAATGRPIRSGGEGVAGAAVVFRDVTRVWEAERDLRDAVERVEEVVRDRDELTRFLVHDLKSPMTSILALCDLLLESEEPGTDRFEMLRQISDSTRTLHRMTLNLLDVQTAEAGRLDPRSEPVELASVVEEVVDVLAGRARLLEMQIGVSNGSSITHVLGDRELLRRVLVNLVDNCIKYGPRGGRVEVDWTAGAEGRVLIRVKDEGPGVPRDLREEIFAEYGAVERNRVARDEGSHGLGLRFCQLAVAEQEGRIWVDDNTPRGACFCVELPAA